MTEIEWGTGLCDCCSDCGSCVLTCLCPCYVLGRIAVIADNAQNIPCYCLCRVKTYCVLWAMCLCCCYAACYRRKMRERVGLQMDRCPDCFAHICCECCALCQEYRQLERLGYDMATGRCRSQGNNTTGPNQVMQAPTTPGGMQAPTTPGGTTGNDQSMSTLSRFMLLFEFLHCVSGVC